MILILGGTTEARELALKLQRSGQRVVVSVVSDYGEDLLKETGIEAVKGPLDEEGLVRLIQELGAEVMVDATHPFAQRVKEVARGACQAAQIPYLRVERGSFVLPDNPLVKVVKNFQEAVEVLKPMGRVVFLTTGVKNLDLLAHSLKGKRLVVRVLPRKESIEKCLSLGIAPKDIIAMQGPFSLELNKALFRQFNADVVVSKESGLLGGFREKLEAALALDLHMVVIKRP